MSKIDWKRHSPMMVTYSRILISPVLLVVLFLDRDWSSWVGAALFIIASITDWLDGHLARKYKAESAMGKLMDPIADKILVMSALVMLLFLNRVDPFMVFLFMGRDTYIGGLRSVAAANNVIIAAKPFGKWKTALQMIAIPCLIIYEPIMGIPFNEIGYYGLWSSVILSLASGAQYTIGYYKGRLN